MTSGASAAGVALSDFRYESRVVITRLDAKNNEQAIALLDSQIEQLKDRSLRIFLVSQDKVSEWKGEKVASLFQQELTRRLANNHTILIGLDGGSKENYESLDLQRIYSDIDSMPMRMSELNK